MIIFLKILLIVSFILVLVGYAMGALGNTRTSIIGGCIALVSLVIMVITVVISDNMGILAELVSIN